MPTPRPPEGRSSASLRLTLATVVGSVRARGNLHRHPGGGARLLGAHHPTVTCRYPLTRYPYPVSSSTSGSPTLVAHARPAPGQCLFGDADLSEGSTGLLSGATICARRRAGGHHPRVQRADELVVAGHGVGEALPSRVR